MLGDDYGNTGVAEGGHIRLKTPDRGVPDEVRDDRGSTE